VLAFPAMAHRNSQIPARLKARFEPAERLAIFRFELEREFHFRPGQYATLWLTHGEQTVKRPYSIASSPAHTRELELYINLLPEGELTLSLWNPAVVQALETRREGTHVAITGPKGTFVLDPDDPRDLVMIASGTGVAPFISMTRLLNEQYLSSPASFRPRHIYLVHGVSHSSHLGYHKELTALTVETLRHPGRGFAVTYLPTVSRPHRDPFWPGVRGRAESLFECPPELDHAATMSLEDTLRALLHSTLKPRTHAVYVCGHPGTVTNIERIFEGWGFEPGRDVKREKYHP
jgi:ferredoxin-NADP reductase